MGDIRASRGSDLGALSGLPAPTDKENKKPTPPYEHGTLPITVIRRHQLRVNVLQTQITHSLVLFEKMHELLG